MKSVQLMKTNIIPKGFLFNKITFTEFKIKKMSCLEPEQPGAVLIALSWSRPHLAEAGVGSGTSDVLSRSRPKKYGSTTIFRLTFNLPVIFQK